MRINVRNMKAQSAMEYLMTYGWAILIIAVVLGALFSLGVFSSGALLGTSCVASSGYLCSSPLLHDGTFTATVGQATGNSWTAVNVMFVAYGAAAPTSASFTAANGEQAPTGGLASGQTFAFSSGNYLAANGVGTTFPSATGTSVSGSIWAIYSTAGQSSLISEMATVSLKAS